MAKSGILYVVATPIGNLQDITLRALDVLREANCIAAEDTRHTGVLLRHFGITVPMVSLHEHNEKTKTAAVLSRLSAGETVALVCDAGTPLISDPGGYLVRTAREKGFQVSPVPGACALVAGLSVSGLPAGPFVFEGFLPARASARRTALTRLQHEVRTLVFYESPHRIVSSLADMVDLLGGTREAVLARELTKIHETLCLSTLSGLHDFVSADANQQRGEYVLMVNGASHVGDNFSQTEKILSVLLESLPLKQAVELTARIAGESKNRLYRIALAMSAHKTS